MTTPNPEVRSWWCVVDKNSDIARDLSGCPRIGESAERAGASVEYFDTVESSRVPHRAIELVEKGSSISEGQREELYLAYKSTHGDIIVLGYARGRNFEAKYWAQLLALLDSFRERLDDIPRSRRSKSTTSGDTAGKTIRTEN